MLFFGGEGKLYRLSYKALNYPKQKDILEKKLPELCIVSQHTPPQTLTKPL